MHQIISKSIRKSISAVVPIVNDYLKIKEQKEIDMTGDQVTFRNAGIIILWPFFTQYFERLGLVEGGTFVNRESQNRAVHLIQYLVNGEEGAPEYELTLNKILAGLPLTFQLKHISEITEDEKNLSLSLLDGLIQNWDKVRNTSHRGIQESFFMRDGIMSIEDDYYKLNVHKVTLDILMHTIPWSLSRIKLQWMLKPLHVQWL